MFSFLNSWWYSEPENLYGSLYGPARNAPNSVIKELKTNTDKFISVTEDDIKNVLNNLRPTKINSYRPKYKISSIRHEFETKMKNGIKDYFFNFKNKNQKYEVLHKEKFKKVLKDINVILYNKQKFLKNLEDIYHSKFCIFLLLQKNKDNLNNLKNNDIYNEDNKLDNITNNFSEPLYGPARNAPKSVLKEFKTNTNKFISITENDINHIITNLRPTKINCCKPKFYISSIRNEFETKMKNGLDDYFLNFKNRRQNAKNLHKEKFKNVLEVINHIS